MDILRCKSPEMIDKELIMHAMASGSDDGSGKKWLKVVEQGKVS